MFQFPSNGKVDSKEIEFTNIRLGSLSFNSLQTGKCIQRWAGNGTDSTTTPTKVSIPFKRESVFKVNFVSLSGMVPNTVSIPFKRESVFKVNHNNNLYHYSINRFNSLQTGKCIQRIRILFQLTTALKFQFPSNGKVYSKKTVG